MPGLPGPIGQKGEAGEVGEPGVGLRGEAGVDGVDGLDGLAVSDKLLSERNNFRSTFFCLFRDSKVKKVSKVKEDLQEIHSKVF